MFTHWCTAAAIAGTIGAHWEQIRVQYFARGCFDTGTSRELEFTPDLPAERQPPANESKVTQMKRKDFTFQI